MSMPPRKPKLSKSSLYRQISPFQMRKGDLRKLEIIQATLECLGTEGYENASFERVGKLCGLKRSHVAYHFPDRETMVSAAIRLAYATAQEIISSRLPSSATGMVGLGAYVESLYYWLETYPTHKAALALLPYLATVSKNGRALNNELKAISVARIQTLMGARATEKTAEQLSTYVFGELLCWATCDVGLSTQVFISRTKATLERLFSWSLEP